MLSIRRLLVFICLLCEICSTQRVVNQCILRCKDNHMREQDNEWSSSFMLPIVELLKTTGNETAAYLKAKDICRSNDLLSVCLNGCNGTTEKQLIRLGVKPWDRTCQGLDDMRSEFSCWKKQGFIITDACSLHHIRLRNSMEYFARNISMTSLPRVCSNYDEFSNCFIAAFGRNCGKNSAAITEKMFESNKEAMFQMIKLRFKQYPLPDACAATITRRDVDFLFANTSPHSTYHDFFLFVLSLFFAIF